MRAIALFFIFSFASCIIAFGFMAANTPALADKVDGKPGCGSRPGCNTPDYGNPTSKPPTKTKKPATAK